MAKSTTWHIIEDSLPKYQMAGPIGYELKDRNYFTKYTSPSKPGKSIPKNPPRAAFDYNDYLNKANKYLSRPVFKGTPLKASNIANAAKAFYKETGYAYPIELLLSQAQMETGLGTKLKSQHNYFNVGNTDSGQTRQFSSPEASIRNYMHVMYNDYLDKGKKPFEKLLIPKNFVNTQGNRYASNPKYEEQLSEQAAYIRKFLSNRQKGGEIEFFGAPTEFHHPKTFKGRLHHKITITPPPRDFSEWLNEERIGHWIRDGAVYPSEEIERLHKELTAPYEPYEKGEGNKQKERFKNPDNPLDRFLTPEAQPQLPVDDKPLILTMNGGSPVKRFFQPGGAFSGYTAEPSSTSTNIPKYVAGDIQAKSFQADMNNPKFSEEAFRQKYGRSRYDYLNLPTDFAVGMNQIWNMAEDAYASMGFDPKLISKSPVKGINQALASIALMELPVGQLLQAGKKGIQKTANYLNTTVPKYVNPNYARKAIQKEDPLLTRTSLNQVAPKAKVGDLTGGALLGTGIGMVAGLGNIVPELFKTHKPTPEELIKLNEIRNKRKVGEPLTPEDEAWVTERARKNTEGLENKAKALFDFMSAGALIGLGAGIGSRNKALIKDYAHLKDNFLGYRDLIRKEEQFLLSDDLDRLVSLNSARTRNWTNQDPDLPHTIIKPEERALLNRYGIGDMPHNLRDRLRERQRAEYLRMQGPTDDPDLTIARQRYWANQNPPAAYIPLSDRQSQLLEMYGRGNREDFITPSHNRNDQELINIFSVPNTYEPPVFNKSRLTKKQVLERVSPKNKDVVSKMPNDEFEKTVLKPSGEIGFYHDASLQPLFRDNNAVIHIPRSDYINEFNSRLDLVNNEIIPKLNESGVRYLIQGIDNSGKMTFHTPAQKAIIKGKEIDIPEGISKWDIYVVPGQWRGNVEDIANRTYYESLPGINMTVSSAGVFPESSGLAGLPKTRAYEAINEYLKRLDLGRVKPGFNSQTETVTDARGNIVKTGSKEVWEHFINSGKAFGYYGNRNTVYGAMKNVLPPAVVIGAAASQSKKQGGPITWQIID